jgi:hypothetical protein
MTRCRAGAGGGRLRDPRVHLIDRKAGALG